MIEFTERTYCGSGLCRNPLIFLFPDWHYPAEHTAAAHARDARRSRGRREAGAGALSPRHARHRTRTIENLLLKRRPLKNPNIPPPPPPPSSAGLARRSPRRGPRRSPTPEQ